MRLAFLLPAVVLLSWADWPPAALGLPARAGFVWASAALAVGLVALATAALRSHVARQRLATELAPHRPLFVAAAAIVATRLLSGATAADVAAGLSVAARDALVLAFLLLFLLARPDLPAIRTRLAWAGLAVLAVHLALFTIGSLIDAGARLFFAGDLHQHAGSLPRFQGWTGLPMQAGWTLLAVAGLTLGLPHARLRLAATTAALGLVVSTFSFASLTVPIVLAGALLHRRRRLRLATLTCLAALALVGLWLNPLRVELAGLRFVDRQPLAAYADGDLGPTHMPTHQWEIRGLQLSFHQTAYFSLFVRGLRCLADHPLLGVGGRNVERECPVMAMNTAGQWAARRTSHSEYGGLAAEQGLLGLAATLLFLWVLLTRYRPARRDAVLEALLVAYLVAAAGGPIWYQFPFAALVGSYWLQADKDVPIGPQPALANSV